MYKGQFSCNVCGKEKGKNNHWWARLVYPEGMLIVVPLTDKVPKEAVHLCGDECVMKEVSRFLGNPEVAQAYRAKF